MKPRKEDGGGREDGVSPTPPPSPRVRLELAFLDADQPGPAPAAPALEGRTCLTVLVVAAEADLRRYVRECLRERTDLRLLEAATVTVAASLAAVCAPGFLIVDEPESAILDTLSHLRAIVIVDEVPHDVLGVGSRVRLLAGPFSAERLLAEVGQLLRR
jgi:hypothetical protein